MSNHSLPRFAAGALLALLAAQAPAADAVRAAGIVHGALVVRAGDGPLQTLQAGGAPRGLPLWSPDGTRIAFVQKADRAQALAQLVVVSSAGAELSRTMIEPVEPDLAYAGMRFVEALRWVAPDRVAVRGSINPSQSQYYVVDVAAGRIVDDFIDDQSAAAFSPDGRHVAVQTGSPHFTPAERRQPQMSVDDRTVYPPAGRHDVDFVSAPRWSDDSRSLAWVVRHRDDASAALVTWNDGAIGETALPLAADAPAEVFWSGARVIVASAGTGAPDTAHAWSADRRGAGLQAVAGRAPLDPHAAALALRRRLADEARAAGLAEPSLWCAACGLEALPHATE